jgi:hypothetical protein
MSSGKNLEMLPVRDPIRLYLRRLLKLLATRSATDMCGQLEYLQLALILRFVLLPL